MTIINKMMAGSNTVSIYIFATLIVLLDLFGLAVMQNIVTIILLRLENPV